MHRVKILLAVSALLWQAASAAATETLVIDAPWLTGTISSGELQGSLTLPANVTGVLACSLQLQGIAVDGSIECWDDPNIYLAPMVLGISAHNDCTWSMPGHWAATTGEISGNVALDLALHWQSFNGSEPGWLCWTEQPMEIVLFCDIALVPICGFQEEPGLTISEARIVLEVEQSVPALSRSWREIKALYE